MATILVDSGEGCNKKDHDDDALVKGFIGGEGHGGIIGEVVGRVNYLFIFFI